MDRTNGWLFFAMLGALLQALGISLFAGISFSNWRPSLGHPIILVGTFLALVLLLWWRLKKHRNLGSVGAAGLCLSFGYVVAFHGVGALAFPGLLRDVGSEGYPSSVFRVFCAVLLLHTACAASVFTVLKILTARTDITAR